MGLEDKIQEFSQRVEEKKTKQKTGEKDEELGINVQGLVAGPLPQREEDFHSWREGPRNEDLEFHMEEGHWVSSTVCENSCMCLKTQHPRVSLLGKILTRDYGRKPDYIKRKDQEIGLLLSL